MVGHWYQGRAEPHHGWVCPPEVLQVLVDDRPARGPSIQVVAHSPAPLGGAVLLAAEQVVHPTRAARRQGCAGLWIPQLVAAGPGHRHLKPLTAPQAVGYAKGAMQDHTPSEPPRRFRAAIQPVGRSWPLRRSTA